MTYTYTMLLTLLITRVPTTPTEGTVRASTSGPMGTATRATSTWNVKKASELLHSMTDLSLKFFIKITPYYSYNIMLLEDKYIYKYYIV